MSDKLEIKIDPNLETSNPETLGQLVATVSLLSDLMTRLIRTHDTGLHLTGSFREDLLELRNKIDRIAKILHEGNGQQPIITRLALVEQKLEQMDKDVEEIKEREEGEQTAMISFKGGLVIAIITAIATVAAALLTMH